MKRPSFQFYPADWQANSNLRRCSHEEKGIWIDIICLLHDQNSYGIIRWSLKEIAQAIGTTPRKIRNLIDKGILKGCDTGQTCEPLTFAPKHGRSTGPEVTLIESQEGPLWYSSRMVVDEYKRQVRAGEIESPKAAPIPPIGAAPMDSPDHSPLRARASSTSSSTSSNNKNTSDMKSDFESLWNSFPVDLGGKGSKKNAFSEFKKLKPDRELAAAMMAALVAQVADKREKRKAGVFVENFQHVERWLKNRRWEDEIGEVEQSGEAVNWI